jgi:hypothetical protein
MLIDQVKRYDSTGAGKEKAAGDFRVHKKTSSIWTNGLTELK